MLSPFSRTGSYGRALNRLLSEQASQGYPAMNIWLNEDGAIVTAEVPGCSPDSLDLSVVNDTLVVKGTRPNEELPEGATYHRRERGCGSFSRSFRLPFAIDAKGVDASFENGVLTITLPRTEEESPRKSPSRRERRKGVMTMAEETRLEVQEAEKQELDQGEAERTRQGIVFVPRTDIYETEDAVYVVCDMPGVSENNVEIMLEQNTLMINGYVEPTEHEDYSLAYREYRVGDYQRRFSLSGEIDDENIMATLKDGVLRLHLPKEQPTSRKISVQAG